MKEPGLIPPKQLQMLPSKKCFKMLKLKKKMHDDEKASQGPGVPLQAAHGALAPNTVAEQQRELRLSFPHVSRSPFPSVNFNGAGWVAL